MGIGKKPQNPTGVIGCTEEVKDPTKPCIKNNTIIEFRPHRGYQGEFGFDWLRVDDTPESQQNASEKIYQESILGSYKSGHAKASTDCPYTPAFKDLKTAYGKLAVNNHRVVPKNEYFVPWLNIFPKDASDKANDDYRNKIQAETGTAQDLPVKPPYEVELRMLANVQGDKPEKVELEFPSEYFTINGAASPFTIPDGNHFIPESPPINKHVITTIKVLCIKEFASDQYIDAYAYQYVYTKSERDSFTNENQTLATENTDLENKNTELATQQTTLEQQKNNAQEAKTTVEQAIKDIAKEVNELNTETTKQLQNETEEEKITAIKNNLTEKLAALTKQMEEQTKLLEEREKTLQEAIDKLNENLRKQRENTNKLNENNKKIEENTKKIEDQKKTLAGKLCVCANDANHRKILKVAQVSVVVSLTGSPLDILTGIFPNDEIERFYNGLYQTLILPEETVVELNLIDDTSFQTGGEFINPNGDLTGPSPTEGVNLTRESQFLFFSWGGIHNHLASKLKDQEKGKYNNFFKAFAINLMCQDPHGLTTTGVVQGIGKKNVIITRLPAWVQPGTYVHEILHGLGLWHTHLHSNSERLPSCAHYVYYAPFAITASYPAYLMDTANEKTTDNIMSYSQQRYTTWHWQWEIVQSNV